MSNSPLIVNKNKISPIIHDCFNLFPPHLKFKCSASSNIFSNQSTQTNILNSACYHFLFGLTVMISCRKPTLSLQASSTDRYSSAQQQQDVLTLSPTRPFHVCKWKESQFHSLLLNHIRRRLVNRMVLTRSE